MQDVASRLANRAQLAEDGHEAYLDAVENALDALGGDIDYAMLANVYGADPRPVEARYSPAICLAANTTSICDDPRHCPYFHKLCRTAKSHHADGHASIYQLTNGFSKKVENLQHAIAIHFMHHNFCRVHQTLRVSPSMEAGLTNHVWEIDEVAGLLS